MKQHKYSLRGWVVFAFIQFFAISMAHAQANQTWVTGFGNDASPTCSYAAPCQTFAAALAQTTAGGEISIDSTGQFGTVTINKSVTINAVGSLGSIVVPAGQNGITIAAGPTDVVILRGLTINGAGVGANGIQFLSGARLHLEHCTISSFTNEGILFQPSGSSTLHVNNVSIRNDVLGAILIQPTVSGTAVAFLNNLKMESNYRGVRAEDRSTVTVRNSIVTGSVGNGFVAISVAGGTVDYTIESSVSSGNANSGVVSSGTNATMRISNFTATRNAGYGLYPLSGGKIISFGNNRVNGNLLGDGAPTTTLSPGQI